MKSKALIDKTLAALEFSLHGRADFFLTTSFGFQSSLLFFLFSEIGVKPKCLFVKSQLATGGIDRQMDYLLDKYDIDLSIVDRTGWLDHELHGNDFMDLGELQRRSLCSDLKRQPLLDYIKSNNFKIWISGIRKDQSQARKSVEFMEVTDLNVIKISPLFAWSKIEVSDLISANKLKINSEYVDLCKLNDSKECGLHY